MKSIGVEAEVESHALKAVSVFPVSARRCTTHEHAWLTLPESAVSRFVLKVTIAREYNRSLLARRINPTKSRKSLVNMNYFCLTAFFALCTIVARAITIVSPQPYQSLWRTEDFDVILKQEVRLCPMSSSTSLISYRTLFSRYRARLSKCR